MPYGGAAFAFDAFASASVARACAYVNVFFLLTRPIVVEYTISSLIYHV